jgi:hypothetical protein
MVKDFHYVINRSDRVAIFQQMLGEFGFTIGVFKVPEVFLESCV